MKKYHLLLLALLGGLLFSFAWPVNGFAPLLFVSFVPLLFIEDYFSKLKQQGTFTNVLLYSSITFLIWNTLTTYWIYNASLFGVIAAILLNTFFMSVVFSLFHLSRKKIESSYSYLILIVYWVAFEYLHLNWDLSWPWLTLGNGFANYTGLVQWYEYTGILGGSLWILLVNIIIFVTIKSYIDSDTYLSICKINLTISILSVIVPIIISFYIYHTYKEEESPVNLVIVQPNIDPYNEKFSELSDKEQLIKFLQLAKEKIDNKTEFLIGPETALVENIWEDKTKESMSYKLLTSFLKEYPNLNFVIGMSSYKMYKSKAEATVTARTLNLKEGLYYDAYNSALQIDANNNIQIYHKSKLVPGVEKMPYPAFFRFLEPFALDLGGIVGTLGMQEERSVFTSKSLVKPAPVICYESIYGEFISEYVKNGANIIFIITNDGWWGDTPGYRQHNAYAKLRAIETRRSIARSANTGISSFINQKGDIIEQTKWWEDTSIKNTLNTNNKLTFYSNHGDYLGKIFLFITSLLLLITFYYFIQKRLLIF